MIPEDERALAPLAGNSPDVRAGSGDRSVSDAYAKWERVQSALKRDQEHEGSIVLFAYAISAGWIAAGVADYAGGHAESVGLWALAFFIVAFGLGTLMWRWFLHARTPHGIDWSYFARRFWNWICVVAGLSTPGVLFVEWNSKPGPLSPGQYLAETATGIGAYAGLHLLASAVRHPLTSVKATAWLALVLVASAVAFSGLTFLFDRVTIKMLLAAIVVLLAIQTFKR